MALSHEIEMEAAAQLWVHTRADERRLWNSNQHAACSAFSLHRPRYREHCAKEEGSRMTGSSIGQDLPRISRKMEHRSWLDERGLGVNETHRRNARFRETPTQKKGDHWAGREWALLELRA